MSVSIPFALLLGLISSLTPTLAQAQDRLERAKKLLASSAEPEVREGASLCVSLDSKESARALLEILRLKHDRRLHRSHYRDVVWVALRQFTDPYAQLEVEEELRTNKKSPLVRQWCAELLGLYGDRRFGETLRKALKDKEEDVRAAAARALGRIRDPSALKSLAKTAKSKNPLVRGNSIEALVLTDPEGQQKRYLQGLKDKDGGVRCMLYGIARDALLDRAEELSCQALEDKDWRVRYQGAQNLETIKTRTAIDALLATTEDGRPVVGKRAIASLQELTGESFNVAEQWKRWWKDKREGYHFPDGPKKRDKRSPNQTVATFNNIVLDSDHVAFLMDKSRAMNDTLESQNVPKDEAAHKELGRVLESMQGRMTFNVFCYEQDVQRFEKKSVELTAKTAKRALEFHEDTSLRGSKDIWSALMAVLEDTDLDTAYLLSSGEPDIGMYVHWDRVTYQLVELNRYHKVVFHAIAYTGSEWNRSQLEHIARATGGEFQAFE